MQGWLFAGRSLNVKAEAGTNNKTPTILIQPKKSLASVNVSEKKDAGFCLGFLSNHLLFTRLFTLGQKTPVSGSGQFAALGQALFLTLLRSVPWMINNS